MGPIQWWRNLRRRRVIGGSHWERLAERHLKKQGLKLLQRNYNTPAGEVDLVMQEKDTIVFVEVRYRKHDQWANAMESVTRSKQKRVIKAAQSLMTKNKWHNQYHARFDVVAIQGNPNEPELTWIQHAFN